MYRNMRGRPDRMSRRKRAEVRVPSQYEYDQSSEALKTLAGNQWSRKFATTASPDSRSERGRRLQSGFGWTPGADAVDGVGWTCALMGSSGHRQPEVPADLAGQVHDQLPVVRGH